MYEHVKTGCKHIPPSEQPLQLAKEATKNSEICYNKIPKSETERQESEKKPQQNGNSNGKPPPKDW